MKRPQCRIIKPGELLAMDPSRLHQGPAGFFWLIGGGAKQNERRGDISIVSIRGELDHHDDGYCESYEGIEKKIATAITGEDAVRRHEMEHRWEDDFKPIAAVPPKTILTRIDSPGGVVSGLNECVAAIQKLIAAHPEIEFCTYIDEMAASAAYALACAFPEILCPRSAILGSIGVISTMISQARKNKRDGYDVRLITSGARKADGHLHAPISNEAVSAEVDRVNKLAADFFQLASKARGISVAQIQKFEAGIFLGPDAVKRKLADSIASFDDVLLGAKGSATPGKDTSSTGGNQTDRRVTSRNPEHTMSIALSALIKKTEAKIATEKDPKKLAALLAALDAYKKSNAAMKKAAAAAKDGEGDDGDDDEDDEDDDADEDEDEDEDEEEEDEEAKAKKAKKAAEEEEAAKKAKKAAAAAEGDEEDDEEEDEESEASAKATLAAVQSLTGMKGKKAIGALQALAATSASVAKDVAELKRNQRAGQKAALITGARGKGQITKAEASFLNEQKLSTVEGFIAMRQKSGFVHVDEHTLVRPKHTQPGTEESLPEETRAMIDSAVDAWQGDKDKYRAELVKAHTKEHAKQLSAAMNGAGNGRI